MANTNDRFNRLLLELGYRKQVYYMHNGVKMIIIFSEDDEPMSLQKLSARYEQWLLNNGIDSKTKFKLNVKLPTYQVQLS